MKGAGLLGGQPSEITPMSKAALRAGDALKTGPVSKKPPPPNKKARSPGGERAIDWGSRLANPGARKPGGSRTGARNFDA